MTAALDAAIERMYAAFADVARPRAIEGCPCCVSRAELTVLTRTTLRALTARQLTGYAESVFLTAGSAADFQYLLPRILELSVRGEMRWPSPEIVCRSLANGGWQAWPAPLQASVANVLAAVWEVVVASGDGSRTDEWICGFARAGLDVRPFLTRLEEQEALPALVGFYEHNSQSLMKGKLSNGFWSDDRGKAVPIIDWFNAPHVVALISRHYGLG